MKKIGSLILSLCILLTLSAFGCAESRSGYVLMNIPYADFYAAEVTDASGLDAVTSATLAKPRAGSLVGGDDHVAGIGAEGDLTRLVRGERRHELRGLQAVGRFFLAVGRSDDQVFDAEHFHKFLPPRRGGGQYDCHVS